LKLFALKGGFYLAAVRCSPARIFSFFYNFPKGERIFSFTNLSGMAIFVQVFEKNNLTTEESNRILL